VIAFPIPTSEPINPVIIVLIAIAAAAGFVAIVFQAVRYFRNSGGRTDVFGPELPRDDTKPGEGDTKDTE
jgi:hypothetical protein